jgi:hypothetical protein
MRSMEWEKYYYFFEMAYNVTSVADVSRRANEDHMKGISYLQQ